MDEYILRTIRRNKSIMYGVIALCPTGHDLPDFGDVVPVYYVISAIFYIILTCDKDYVINRTVLKGLERIIQYGIIPQRHKLLWYIAVHPAALSGCKDYCRDLYFIHCIKDFYI